MFLPIYMVASSFNLCVLLAHGLRIQQNHYHGVEAPMHLIN